MPSLSKENNRIIKKKRHQTKTPTNYSIKEGCAMIYYTMLKSRVLYKMICQRWNVYYVTQNSCHLQTHTKEYNTMTGLVKKHLTNCVTTISPQDIEIIKSIYRNVKIRRKTYTVLSIEDSKTLKIPNLKNYIM